MNNTNKFKELRGFLLFWSTQTLSELGTAMTDYALVIWVYSQKGTASDIMLLTICSFMPTILFRFIAGTFADRGNKKRIMLIADLAAACGTLTIFCLYSGSALRVWHLYIINTLLSFMNSFQVPASFVAASMLVPKEYYAKVGGLQSFAGSAVSILAPALASFLLAFGGLETVLTIDLITFSIAFLVLLFLVKIPETDKGAESRNESFAESCKDGLRYLKEHKAIFHITLFIAVIYFLAKLGGDGMIAPFILGRTGNDQRVLGLVQSCEAIGIMVGSLLVTVIRPARNKYKRVFVTCAMIFAGDIILSLTLLPAVWCAANLYTYAVAAIMNTELTLIMRENVPTGMQGRVFSAKDTMQNCTIPLGLYLGGVLADHVFEPLMKTDSAAQKALSLLFGKGPGAGIAVLFFIAGALGIAVSLTRLGKPLYDQPDN